VFVTFVVQDSVRDNVKDIVANLQTAENAFRTRRDGQASADLLDVMSQRINLIWDATPSRMSYLAKTPVDTVSSDLEDLDRQARQLDGALENASHQVEALPEEGKYRRARLKTLRAAHRSFTLKLALFSRKSRRTGRWLPMTLYWPKMQLGPLWKT
jgi:hypothetical protein